MVLLAYPVFETLFSVYRRQFLRGQNPGSPDALHLHQLVYLRLARVLIGSRDPLDMTHRNSMVARYIWIGSAIFILIALLLWRNTPALIVVSFLFYGGYIWLYRRLIHWRAPVWMISSS